MSLPHYKLRTEFLPDNTGQFPVLLAPTETPRRFAWLRQSWRSHKLLIGLVLLSLASSATLLWWWLDPTIKAPKPIYLWVPAITLSLCLFIFLLLAMTKNRVATPATEEQDESPVPLAFPVPKAKPALSPKPARQTEVNLEQWSSEEFEEIIDEAIIADVFDDELVAPDHLILSVKMDE